MRARADRVCGDVVVDIKTGAAPSKKQLCDGTMPQLPLEAHMLRSGGFGAAARTDLPRMMFLQLRGGDVRAISYDAAETKEMIDAALAKVTELFNHIPPAAARTSTDYKTRLNIVPMMIWRVWTISTNLRE